LFSAVFSIAEKDANKQLKINYIDGNGLSCVLADAHKGQALGTKFFLLNSL
jgi:hypothetical protein